MVHSWELLVLLGGSDGLESGLYWDLGLWVAVDGASAELGLGCEDFVLS